MSSVLEAPASGLRREHAREFLSELPQDLSQAELTIRFADRSIAATSFIDELIYQLLVERNALSVTLENLNEATCSVALAAAVDFGCMDRLSCV